MPEITAKDVQALRKATGAGMMDCKRALEQCDGDQEKAKLWLREQGLAGAAKRMEREATQGAVAIGSGPEATSIAELRCETDFVAKATDFVELVEDLARLVASKGEEAVTELTGRIDDLRTTLKENISVGRLVRFEHSPGTSVGTYLHIQAGRGVNAAIVEVAGGDESKRDELAHDIAVHMGFARPAYLRREDVPTQEVEAERGTLETITRNEGKPEPAISKIVEGRLNGWFKERVLLEQAYAKDEKLSISQLLEGAGGAEIRRFAQVVIGS